LTDEQRHQRRTAISTWIEVGFNATRAARALDRDPATFYRWISSLDLDRFRSNDGRRVLFVDDQGYKKREVEDALLSAGLLVDLADDGQSALDRVDRFEYACVVTDQMMQGMDGLELCELILKRRPSMPIVLLTAYPDFALCRRAMREGLVKDVVPWAEFGENPAAFGAAIVDFIRLGNLPRVSDPTMR
jgi:CheY-like chemotaxis protein